MKKHFWLTRSTHCLTLSVLMSCLILNLYKLLFILKVECPINSKTSKTSSTQFSLSIVSITYIKCCKNHKLYYKEKQEDTITPVYILPYPSEIIKWTVLSLNFLGCRNVISRVNREQLTARSDCTNVLAGRALCWQCNIFIINISKS